MYLQIQTLMCVSLLQSRSDVHNLLWMDVTINEKNSTNLCVTRNSNQIQERLFCDSAQII